MAINKSNTSPAMKAMLIFLIIAFVAGFIPFVAGAFQQPAGTTAPGSTTATNTVNAIDAQYQPQIAALNAALASDPESYTVLVNLGNVYFDWAVQKQQASQTSTANAGADAPLWIAAKDAYGRAIAIRATESPVRVDYAITLYYSGDVKGAIAAVEGVAKDDPTFAPAFFNGGIFYRAAGDNAKAIAAFEQYLKLDPNGQQGGNADFAKQQLSELKAAQ